ncbi:MAG: helix-turn-helix domain-containing protein [Chloroflexaceae bacterium]|nr:helix-turn-helix domain-containing protein [Chloroflexaceae bacterium]
MKVFDGITLYTTAEVAEQLGVSVQLVRKLMREGKIKGRKIGNAWYIPAEAVKSYLTTGEGYDN